jgi:hypothetical protein
MNILLILNLNILQHHVSSSGDVQAVNDRWSEFETQLQESRALLYNHDSSTQSNTTSRPGPVSALKIAEDCKLDVDQSDTFLTLVHHILQAELFKENITKIQPKQMICYLGGEGGTGSQKSCLGLV